MPEKITLADGTEREVPTADEEKELRDKATKVDTVEQTHSVALKNLREHTKNLEKQLRDKGGNPAPMPGEAVDPADIVKQSTEAAQNVVQANETKRLEKYRDKKIAELSGGDENKKKVIEEKFNRATGGRPLTDETEIDSFIQDAAFLANKTKDVGLNNPIFKSGGEPVGVPIRGNSETRARGAEIAKEFGYEVKHKEILS